MEAVAGRNARAFAYGSIAEPGRGVLVQRAEEPGEPSAAICNEARAKLRAKSTGRSTCATKDLFKASLQDTYQKKERLDGKSSPSYVDGMIFG